MSETESRWRCKVVVLRREGGRVRFGVARRPAAGAAPGGVAFPTGPFPNLLAIDAALAAFAREKLGIERVRIHERFVERPDPEGAIYYLIEAEHPSPGGAAGTLTWLDAADAARRLDPPDRVALARAIRFLSGTGAAP